MADPPPQPDLLDEAQLAQLGQWRQGDVVALQQQVWLAHGDLPTTAASKQSAAAGKLFAMHESAPEGHAVLTQTCDLVPRTARDRPFVSVAPLVQLDDELTDLAARGRLTRFAHIPTYRDGAFCADLDRITTIETGVLLACNRMSSLDADQQRLAFAQAVARKFSRFAFPDDLVRSIQKWRNQVISKHGREHSPEGELYRLALDVLVTADPSWDAERIQVTIAVLLPAGILPPPDADADPEVAEVDSINRLSAGEIAKHLLNGDIDMRLGALMCNRLQDEWAHKCEPTGVIESVRFQLLGTADLTAAEYLNSSRLDLEFLSIG
ncbi:MAG: hypothetical protein OXN79_04505 [bacterium]|nr:hypothetical protein [bacterium]